uniref:Uncharacterized protein n=1 Tax=Rhizophora mucronata TaxID=61149 RepID=A0A2P2P5N5_RHIMU
MVLFGILPMSQKVYYKIQDDMFCCLNFMFLREYV